MIIMVVNKILIVKKIINYQIIRNYYINMIEYGIKYIHIYTKLLNYINFNN